MSKLNPVGVKPGQIWELSIWGRVKVLKVSKEDAFVEFVINGHTGCIWLQDFEDGTCLHLAGQK